MERVRPKTRPSSDRRPTIVQALDRCIRSKGIAATSLTDIAMAADMSLNHVRYYFGSKEEVIKFYLSKLCDELIAGIEAIERTTPQQWLEDFVAFYVADPRLNPTSIGVLVEIFGVSVHNSALSLVKKSFNEAIRNVFVRYFEWAGVAPGLSVEQAAYTAWCLETGIKFNAAFEDDFSRERAGQIFLAEMRRMSGKGHGPS